MLLRYFFGLVASMLEIVKVVELDGRVGIGVVWGCVCGGMLGWGVVVGQVRCGGGRGEGWL